MYQCDSITVVYRGNAEMNLIQSIKNHVCKVGHIHISKRGTLICNKWDLSYFLWEKIPNDIEKGFGND